MKKWSKDQKPERCLVTDCYHHIHTSTQRYEEISKIRPRLITAVFVTCSQQEPLCPNSFYIHIESLISFTERISLWDFYLQHKFYTKIYSINLTAVILLQEQNYLLTRCKLAKNLHFSSYSSED